MCCEMKRVYELNEFKKMNCGISQMCYKQKLLWCDHDSLIYIMIRRFNVLIKWEWKWIKLETDIDLMCLHKG